MSLKATKGKQRTRNAAHELEEFFSIPLAESLITLGVWVGRIDCAKNDGYSRPLAGGQLVVDLKAWRCGFDLAGAHQGDGRMVKFASEQGRTT
jgi:hypothetical protein